MGRNRRQALLTSQCCTLLTLDMLACAAPASPPGRLLPLPMCLTRPLNCIMRAGLQYSLPGTWHGMAARQLPVQLLTQWWSTFPAHMAGMARQKGAIAVGMDADLVVSSRFSSS